MTQGERKEEMKRAQEGARSNKRAGSDVEGRKWPAGCTPRVLSNPTGCAREASSKAQDQESTGLLDPQKRMSWFRYKETCKFENRAHLSGRGRPG
jgi:hypothetical protein